MEYTDCEKRKSREKKWGYDRDMKIDERAVWFDSDIATGETSWVMMLIGEGPVDLHQDKTKTFLMSTKRDLDLA